MATPRTEPANFDWSSAELATLLNQALALEFIKLRNEQKKKDAEKTTGTAWKAFFSSTAFTTILTVFVGTIGGTVIANAIQEKSKQLSERQQIVDEAFTDVAKTVAAAQQIIDISADSWDEKRFAKDERTDIISQKRVAWKTYNSALADWRVQRERIGFLLVAKGVGSNDQPQAHSTWQALASAVETFTACAVRYNQETADDPEPEEQVREGCKEPRLQLREGLQSLAMLTSKPSDRSFLHGIL